MAEQEKGASIAASPDEPGRRASNRRRTERSGGGSGPLVGVMLAILVAALGVVGWYLFNQHAMLAAEQQETASAQQRLKVLEDRLRVTDQVMTETEAETDEQLEFWESEVRKLWTVANERNRKWIQDNQARIKSQDANIETLLATDKTLASQVSRHEQAFTLQKQFSTQLSEIEAQLRTIVRNQRDMVDRINAATRQLTDLSDRVTETEQAIAAIDAYRSQVNRRLAAIEGRLKQKQALQGTAPRGAVSALVKPAP